MDQLKAHGAHVFLDYTGYVPQQENDGAWMLTLMEQAVEECKIRNVHSHVEQFDGSVSPLGFAAVVLLDESHVSAHCYSEKGWLAVDCFTCGGSNPNELADFIHQRLMECMPLLSLKRRHHQERFLHEGE
ncbi:MAG: S-adenosylmethionine decarboxylase [Candidatus Poseidoniaceae archaeon]|nr:S-adenosylmethionine decarboxylase [Candidatus Poseidoniaceae archaeon]